MGRRVVLKGTWVCPKRDEQQRRGTSIPFLARWLLQETMTVQRTGWKITAHRPNLRASNALHIILNDWKIIKRRIFYDPGR